MVADGKQSCATPDSIALARESLMVSAMTRDLFRFVAVAGGTDGAAFHILSGPLRYWLGNAGE
jgi:hypothetical protein